MANLNVFHKKLAPLFLWGLSILFVFIGAVTVQASTYYVATTGNDANPGTASQAFRTIARGLRSLNFGDTLYIRGGTYAESIDSNDQTIPTGTSWTDAPLISAYPGETVTLARGTINLAANYIQYVQFAGLTLDGGYQNVSVGETAHHVKFTNMVVKNGSHQCVQVGLSSHHIWFTGGKVHDCGLSEPLASSGYLFYISGNDNLIENIEAYNSNRYCVHIYYSLTPKPARNIVRNSIFHHCALQSVSSAAILLSGGDSNMAYNNILYSNSGHGIQNLSGTNAKIYNNTVYGGSQTGIYIQPNATGADVQNNIAYGNATTQILNQGTGTTLDHNLTTNPLFVNPVAFNFNLRTSSPAIDAGVALSIVTTDFKQVPRPQGAAYDIGAYEGGISLDSTPPAPPFGLRIN